MKVNKVIYFFIKRIIPAVFTLLTLPAISFAQFSEIKSPFKNQIKRILQDNQGYIWIASETSIAYYDGYQFNLIDLKLTEGNAARIADIEFISPHELLIATQSNGLFTYSLIKPSTPKSLDFISNETIYAITKSPDDIWVASKQGVYRLQGTTHAFYPFEETELYVNQIIYRNGQLLLASINKLIIFDTELETFNYIKYPKINETAYIWDIYLDQKNDLIISTDIGIFIQNRITHNWVKLNHTFPNSTARTLLEDKDNFWIGTTNNGLIQKPKTADQSIKRFSVTNSNIPSNSITTFFSDNDANLWLGFFDGSFTKLSKNSVIFGLNTDILNRDNCENLTSETIDILEDRENNLWLATTKEIVKIDKKNYSCQSLKLPTKGVSSNRDYSPRILFTDSQGNLWANYYQLGLVQITHLNPTLDPTIHPLNDPNTVFYQFITQTDEKTFIFATSSGIISHDIKNGVTKNITSEIDNVEKSIVYSSYPISATEFLLGTSKGVVSFDGQYIENNDLIQNQLPTKNIQSVYIDSMDNIWIGSGDAGLFKFNPQQKLIESFDDHVMNDHYKITNIIEDNHANLWVSTETNLVRLDIETDQAHIFDVYDGLQSKKFILGSGFKAQNGKLYFGGLNGFNAFHPNQIKVDQKPPPIVLTKLSRFNKTVKPTVDYEGFKINQAIDFTNELTLSHKDYVMGFEFAALNYVAPEKNQYAYQLDGFDPDWNYVDANNRRATYTDLPSGKYTFRVKGSNKYGIWNEEGRSLAITVKPAPWFSWWALLSYAGMLILVILFYINKKVKDSKKQAALLKLEVNNKTQELKIQKQKVESLLIKKNELFSNVSHEFRTPLTLILGPIKELISQGHNTEGIQSLNVINRNANRLLSLVEQLLQLARISDNEKVSKNTQQTQSQVQSVVDSFEHMAKNKKLKLRLIRNENAHIHVTDQCLDAILGNLISNAIKYTQIGGQVDISAEVDDTTFRVKVKDSGAGLSEIQQKDIFKRFKRLDTHQEIEGIGIGLSVVEEVVKINQGHIDVISEVGIGSEFIVTLPLSESSETADISSNHSLVAQLASEPTISAKVINTKQATTNDNLNNVLVIEDNQDMRDHIVSIIDPHYNTMTAKHGKEGVALAIEHIPDLIICDVMMPEMDGFKVSRIIRSDERTSHIPLILLTALNDKTSRIKGWREHVDAYMTKPFDRDELLVQLENMLTIRDILKKKTGQNMLSSTHQNNPFALSKKDQNFIDKLMQLIELNYPNTMLSLSVLADKMATSDRQLQRKLKALTDQNPMDLLREFRLKKACEFLKDGEQVSQIADACGFNSVSYFSTCFKAQYGMPPKKYQQTAAGKATSTDSEGNDKDLDP